MKIKLHNKPIALLLLTLFLTNCVGPPKNSTRKASQNPSREEETLKIWWNRSYYIQEDEAIEAAIAAWQEETGNNVEFSFFSEDDILKETKNALETQNAPDIIFSIRADDTIAPRWAWEGKLADVSDVVEPLKDLYTPAALQAVNMYNNSAQKRSVYGIPIKQQAVHIHYWRELLEEAGFTEENIPTEWDYFWAFWMQVQENLRAKGREDIYGFGFPMSSEASDTHSIFDYVLEAYDVQLFEEDGRPRLQNPQVRQDIVRALKWYTSFYQAGYVPEDAQNWTDGSNNNAFLNKKVVMTINPSLSIPGSQREDEEIYYDEIATLGFPNEPDGERLIPIVTVKHVILFDSSANKDIAKDFLSYLAAPQNLGPYLEGSLGRYFPVMPQISSTPFWNDPADPHIFAATQQFQNGTRSTYQSLNPAYTNVQAENVWGRAMEQIIIDGVSPQDAADLALQRIEEICAEWDL